MTALNLRKFDINNIAKGSIVYLYGKRNTGKSFLVRDLLHSKRDIPMGIVVSPTEMANKFYSDMVPPMFIYDEYSQHLIESLVKRQIKVVKKMEKQKLDYGNSNIDPFIFFIMDDCIGDTTWTKDKNIKTLFVNGRHLKVLYILTSQYPLAIPPLFRTNIDYVFILRDNIINNRKRLYDNFAGMFPTFDMFNQVMDQCTENYECIVIDCVNKSNKIEDIVFWYKADEHPPFHIGKDEFWRYSKPADDEEDETFNPDTMKRARTPHISVKKQN